ncbi:conjugal transfer protein [Enterococcus faecalis]|uniref:conjugal transfer protein n=1 Tax=Enterococcus faecalis TaxID=1351 RepID=UPI0019FD7391|nr:conjugal transfer protein [Enterococcus faecalis]EGO2595435.1 conjugal transfer protein [Enterococcus faecalis]EGO2806916.1 conjugal transfer protein [Enterococcus faecalis]EGO5168974.1 conjugal transfer protein [Enterococcus faecalis]EGO6609389.1 conjugal transfer protein [Enterococcus faecalis]EGO9052085.1 conjugal transfer protein [Enterococcus faecalis]
MNFIKEKKRPKPVTPKEEKAASIRTIRLSVLILTLFLVVSGPMALFQSSKMQGMIKNEQAALTQTIQEELSKNTSTPVVSELYKQFLHPFITTYISVPADQKAFEERLNTLQDTYFNFEQEEEKNTGLERKLLSANFYDLVSEQGQTIAKYRIAYEITAPVTKEREVKKKEGDKEVTVKEKYIDYEKSEVKTLLNIPFVQLDNQSFKVIAYPYFSMEPSLTSGKALQSTIDRSQYQRLENQEEKAITSFVQAFLEKYVSDSIEDMSFLMKEPELLTGDYQIADASIEPLIKEKQIVVFVTFRLVDGQTKSSHIETMTLRLKHRDNTYFIEKLQHYLGGI